VAVTNLTVLEGNQPTPETWFKDPVDLNQGAGGAYLYFAFEKGGALSNVPITNIYFATGEHPTAPPGYELIGVDLNKGSGGEYIWTCYSRTPGPAPIQHMVVVSSDNPNPAPPQGFTLIAVDLNKGAGGKYIYLTIRR
jgi:hypothetical protein